MTSNLTKKDMNHFLRPELRNRIDEIIHFNNLNKEALDKIVELNIQSLIDKLNDQGINCSINGGVRKHLTDNGFQPEYGARPMKRLIRRDILAEISKYMLENPGQNSFQVDYDNGVMISQA